MYSLTYSQLSSIPISLFWASNKSNHAGVTWRYPFPRHCLPSLHPQFKWIWTQITSNVNLICLTPSPCLSSSHKIAFYDRFLQFRIESTSKTSPLECLDAHWTCLNSFLMIKWSLFLNVECWWLIQWIDGFLFVKDNASKTIRDRLSSFHGVPRVCMRNTISFCVHILGLEALVATNTSIFQTLLCYTPSVTLASLLHLNRPQLNLPVSQHHYHFLLHTPNQVIHHSTPTFSSLLPLRQENPAWIQRDQCHASSSQARPLPLQQRLSYGQMVCKRWYSASFQQHLPALRRHLKSG